MLFQYKFNPLKFDYDSNNFIINVYWITETNLLHLNLTSTC